MHRKVARFLRKLIRGWSAKKQAFGAFCVSEGNKLNMLLRGRTVAQRRRMARLSVLPLAAFFLAFILGSTSICTYCWFALRWESNGTYQTFSSASPSDIKVTMWTNDTTAEGGQNNWTCKYSDYDMEPSEIQEKKLLPSIGTVTTSGNNSILTVADVKNLTFGQVDDLVNPHESNEVYFRFASRAISRKGDTLTFDFNFASNYAKCFGQSGSTAYADVTNSVNALLAADRSGDNLSNLAIHQYFTVEYMFLPITDDETTPSVGDVWTKASEPCNLAANQSSWTTLGIAGSENSVTVSVPAGTELYYFYLRLKPNLSSQNGLRTVIKHLYRFMPCVLSFDVNVKLEDKQAQ